MIDPHMVIPFAVICDEDVVAIIVALLCVVFLRHDRRLQSCAWAARRPRRPDVRVPSYRRRRTVGPWSTSWMSAATRIPREAT